MRKSLAALTAALLLSACAVSPDYRAPDISNLAPAREFIPADPDLYTAAEPVAEFWAGFRDPLLTRLVEDSLSGNTDLRVAIARLDRARALSRQSRLDLLPTVTAAGGYTAARVPASRTPAGTDRDTES